MSPQPRAMTPDRRHRLELGLVVEPGDARLTELLERFTPAEIVAAVSGGHELRVELPASWISRAAHLGDETEAVIARGRAAGLRWVCPGEAEWPSRLRDLDRTPSVGGSRGEPLGLWVKGPLQLAEAVERSVSIVGARDATSYGCDVASDLAADVADAGVTVVSGAAYGIDSAAHRGALGIGAPTLAVLACGADVDYPRAHAVLLARIAESGLVVSEQAPGRTPTKGRFLTRNRIIAGLSIGTVVVEAARRSGALNTVGWAVEAGRVVMGVPGPVSSQASVGVHQALRSGSAVVVTNGAEVLEAIDPIGVRDATLPWTPPTAFDVLPRGLQIVLEAVPAGVCISTSSVAASVGCAVDAATVVLERLAADGWVDRAERGWTLRRRADLSSAPPASTVSA